MMNTGLIDVLGGYEKAKNILESERQSENIDPVIYVGGDEILIDVICDALLQYRIEHGIFEVGDPIIFAVMSNSVLYFDECLRMFLSQGLIRHATTEEIAAGRRLGAGQ